MTSLVRLLKYLGNYRGAVLATLLFLAGTSVLGLMTPLIIQNTIDNASEYGSMSIIGLYAAGVVGIAIVNGLCGFGQRFAMATAVQGAIFDLRNELFNFILHLPFGYHDRSRTGQLISRMTSDMEHITRFFSFGLSSLVSISFTFVGASIMLFRMSWQLGVLGLLMIPPLTATAFKGSNTLGPLFYTMRQQFGRITAQLQENFSGVRVVKAFAREEHEIAKFRRELNTFLSQRMGMIRIFAMLMPLTNFLTSLGTLMILALGGWLVIGGGLTLGQLVASQGYLMMLTGPIRMIGFMTVMARRATASGQRVFEVLDAEIEIQDKPDAIALPLIEGTVCFEDVSFGYDEESRVLQHINLVAHPGETVALLGHTGSGKTSVINLVPRFYDVTEGRVTIDGHDVRDVTLHSLRSQIGTIFQEAVLFSGTIAENIAFGRTDATQEQIEAAAKAAQAHDFIMHFPDGYETRVGERGVTLSGGQRQRTTIARALLLDARILIMDDSTSSVDVETEYLIQQALADARRGRTSFVIAHRLSTVKNADRIVVLDAGEIVQEGTHEALLAVEGPYRRIYETQFAEQEEMV